MWHLIQSANLEQPNQVLVSATYNRLFQKKSNRRAWGYTVLKSPLGNYRFVTLPQEIPEIKSFYLWKFFKFVWHPLEIPNWKTKTPGNSHISFSWTPVEFPHLFQLIPGISTCFFFKTPRNSMSSTPPCLDFFPE